MTNFTGENDRENDTSTRRITFIQLEKCRVINLGSLENEPKVSSRLPTRTCWLPPLPAPPVFSV